MEMPKPGNEHRRLEKLAGAWVGEETIHPTVWDPQGGKARGKMTARMALSGFHLIVDYEQNREGKLNFEGHGVFGWDPRGKCYTMHWFDSMGVEHGAPFFGSWEEDVLTLQHEMKPLGHSRQVFSVGPEEYRLRLENSPDGREWTTFLEGTYHRLG